MPNDILNSSPARPGKNKTPTPNRNKSEYFCTIECTNVQMYPAEEEKKTLEEEEA